MSSTLIPVKTFIGRHYVDLLQSTTQEKYVNTGLDTFFEQRFHIQDNTAQMVVDPSMDGLSIAIAGNEIYISKALYDHPHVVISNSVENDTPFDAEGLYHPGTFSTIAYLLCQNHTTLRIIGNIDEPIYVKYKADYETFYNSVMVFNIADGIDVEIVEEIESFSALNSVANYILFPRAKLKLTTFYQNHITALSFCYRNIIAQDNSEFEHILFGTGCTNIIDENKIQLFEGSTAEFLGIVNSLSQNFHSLLHVDPASPEYKVYVDYRNIVDSKSKVSFYPVMAGSAPSGGATIEVSNIDIDDVPAKEIDTEVAKYIEDIASRAVLDRMIGVLRFYKNKSKFLNF